MARWNWLATSANERSPIGIISTAAVVSKSLASNARPDYRIELRAMMLGYILLAIVVIGTVIGVVRAALRPPPPPGLTDAAIRAELRKGNRLEAIRWYRTLHRVGLKRAKEGIEKLEREQ